MKKFARIKIYKKNEIFLKNVKDYERILNNMKRKRKPYESI